MADLSSIGQDLLVELLDVRKCADEVNKCLSEHNYLPKDFPKAQVHNICAALSGLADGSLQGSRIPLEHAIVRLSEVRRSYFSTDASEIGIQHDEDPDEQEPSLIRNDYLDTLISKLISSATTALDAYRFESRTPFESHSTDEFLEVIPQVIYHSEATSLQKNAGSLSDLLDKTRPYSSKAVQDLGMSAADARNAALATEAEASFRVVFRAWLRSLAGRTADALGVLRKTIDALRVGGGEGYDFYKRFRSSISNVRDVVVSELDGWLEYISERIKVSEDRLRSSANSDSQKKLGVIRNLHGNRVVVSEDSIPYAIDPSTPKTHPVDSVVSFSISARDGHVIAHSIDIDRDHIYFSGDFLHLDAAKSKISKEIVKYIRDGRSKIINKRALRRIGRKLSISPERFWEKLGYNELDSFLGTIPDLYGVRSEQGQTDYFSTRPPSNSEVSISKEDYLDWVQRYLEKEGTARLGELAELSKAHFGLLIPVRVALGSAKFRDVFHDDPRFVVKKDVIMLRAFLDRESEV